MAKGFVVEEGTSALNGEPIVAIMTAHSSNATTGNMGQVWIMPKDVAPLDALKSGAAESVCGDCPHLKTGACYVTITRGPYMVWECYKNGGYVRTEPSPDLLPAWQPVRLGAYGDPAALTPDVIAPIIEGRKHTGYTHQWRKPEFQWLKSIVMASCDSPEDYVEATSMGWRTLRIRMPEEPLLEGEILCPASPEGGMKTQCFNCGLCCGTSKNGPNIGKVVHGLDWKVQRFREWRKQ